MSAGELVVSYLVVSVNVRGGIHYRWFLGKRNLDALHENLFINT